MPRRALAGQPECKGNRLRGILSNTLAGFIKIGQTSLSWSMASERRLMEQLRGLLMIADLLANETKIVVICCTIDESAGAVRVAGILRPQGT